MPDIDHLHTVYKERRRRITAAVVLVCILAAALAAGAWPLFAEEESGASVLSAADRSTGSTFLSSIGFMKDTVYTTTPEFLEVLLDSQILVRHARDGGTRTIPISTGNPALKKGIETRPGIFLVQNRIEWLYSLQFDSTKVFNWLGFNWGVGFHSLAGHGYYRHLGKHPSSHGCIRVAEADAQELFRTVSVGTPVFVHKAAFARLVAFSPEGVAMGDTTISRAEAEAIHARRLQDLCDGTRLYHTYPQPAINRRTIGHSGIPVGDESRVPIRQRIPPTYAFFHANPRVLTAGATPAIPARVARMEGVDAVRYEPSILP